MFKLWHDNQGSAVHPHPAPNRPAPVNDGNLPASPSLEGYTIDELRTEQLAHLLNFEELQPGQVAHLIRALTNRSR